MGFDWNVFRIMADVSHTLSKCILIFSIHSNKSAEGKPATAKPSPSPHLTSLPPIDTTITNPTSLSLLSHPLARLITESLSH